MVDGCGDVTADQQKFFIIKSYTVGNILQSVLQCKWSSTDAGNKKLQEAFASGKVSPAAMRNHNINNNSNEVMMICWRSHLLRQRIFLLVSANGSGHFQGLAEMTSRYDENSPSPWKTDKFKGSFDISWKIIKNIPNHMLANIKLPNDR